MVTLEYNTVINGVIFRCVPNNVTTAGIKMTYDEAVAYANRIGTIAIYSNDTEQKTFIKKKNNAIPPKRKNLKF
jgi:hypothetical protein